MGSIWLLVLLIFLIAVEAALVVIFLRQARNSYYELAEESAERLWPPALRLLAFLPILGNKLLLLIQEATNQPMNLRPPNERNFIQDEQVLGDISPYILIEEQHNRATGENDGIRFHVLDNKKVYTIVSQPEYGINNEPNEINALTARPVHKRIIWGYLDFDGEHWILENLAVNGEIFPVLGSITNQYMLKGFVTNTRRIEISSGDKFLIGVSDFCLIDLSRLSPNLDHLEEIIDLN